VDENAAAVAAAGPDEAPPWIAAGYYEPEGSEAEAQDAPAASLDEDTSTGPLASQEPDEGVPTGEEAGADAGDAAFITGESVSLSTGDTDTGALAGRSARAGDDPIFASLDDAEYDIPSDAARPAAPYMPYGDEDSEDADQLDAAGEASPADVVDAPPAEYDAPAYDDAAYGAAAYDATPYDAPVYNPTAYDYEVAEAPVNAEDSAYEATPEPAPEQAPEAVRDLASDISRDAENTPEIVGAPVAMAIPTTSVTTLKVEDQDRSRNQLLVAGIAAIALLVLCVAVVLAVRNAGRGTVTPTAEALVSPTETVPIVAIATIATWTPDTSLPNPTTDAIPFPTETGTSEPVVLPTDTVLTVPTEAVLPTDTSLPLPTDTQPPAPTDTSVPLPTDTVAPAPTDTLAPVPTDTLAPAPTDTQRPQPTDTQSPRPTSTPVPPRPTATRPPVSSSHSIGDTVTGFNGWTVLPMWTVTRSQLPSPNAKVFYKPSGVYWLVRMDVRNTVSRSRSLGGTMDFVLKDANGNLYAELSNHGKAPGVREIARKEGFSYLDTVLDEGEAAATLLIYDIPRGVQPTQLIGRIRDGDGVMKEGQVVWNLGR
jgi:hypothetical protein